MDTETKMWREYTKVSRALLAHPRFDRNKNKIEMRMSFNEWKDVWTSSGKYDLKGRGTGKYCMSRRYDVGHYEIGNVFIQLFVQNTIDAHKGRKDRPETRERKRLAKLGVHRGSYKKRGVSSQTELD